MKRREKGSFHHKERVRWVDTDASRRIHFAAMFRFFETAEIEFLRSRGFTYNTLLNQGVDLPRVRAECSYSAPVTYDEILDIEVRVERVGNSSVALRHVARRQDGVVAAEGCVIFCAIDTNTGRSTPLPAALRQALASIA